MNSKYQAQLDKFVANIEARNQLEKVVVLLMIVASIAMLYITMAFDPIRGDISSARGQIRSVDSQIQAQQLSYANMVAESQEDPNKFANDRLMVIARAQTQLETEIRNLAGDLVTPNEMTTLLESLLARQAGLQLLTSRNETVTPLRQGISNEAELLADSGAVNFEDVQRTDVSGQVYQHGLFLEFEGDFFSTLKYLRFLEEVTGSFFWDSISFRQLEWPNAHVTLEIHTLSTDEGFIGV